MRIQKWSHKKFHSNLNVQKIQENVKRDQIFVCFMNFLLEYPLRWLKLFQLMLLIRIKYLPTKDLLMCIVSFDLLKFCVWLDETFSNNRWYSNQMDFHLDFHSSILIVRFRASQYENGSWAWKSEKLYNLINASA